MASLPAALAITLASLVQTRFVMNFAVHLGVNGWSLLVSVSVKKWTSSALILERSKSFVKLLILRCDFISRIRHWSIFHRFLGSTHNALLVAAQVVSSMSRPAVSTKLQVCPLNTWWIPTSPDRCILLHTGQSPRGYFKDITTSLKIPKGGALIFRRHHWWNSSNGCSHRQHRALFHGSSTDRLHVTKSSESFALIIVKSCRPNKLLIKWWRSILGLVLCWLVFSRKKIKP